MNIFKKKKEFTEKEFTEKVDNMLKILYKDDNNIDKIDELIQSVCRNLVNTGITINNSSGQKYNNFQKILPCNNDLSLIKSKINLKSKTNKNIVISGTQSKIYKNIIQDKIFKKSIFPNSYVSLFSMLVDYLLYETVVDKHDYLCKIYEIGQYTPKDDINTIFFYEIMDNCGISIENFIEKIKYDDNEPTKTTRNVINNKILFNNLLIIFYKMIYGIKILHDLGYAHLDIKPANFLISCATNNLEEIIFTENIGELIIENISKKKKTKEKVLVKIIDFGTIRKIGEEITISSPGIGTPEYANKDLLVEKNKKEITITINPKHDILSLKKCFIYIIGVILFEESSIKSYKLNNVENFNEKISKILENLKLLTQFKELLIILENIDKYTNINSLLTAFSRLSNINTTNRQEITKDNYTIYYYVNGRSLPYIIENTNPTKKYPITKDIIKKIVNDKSIDPTIELSENEKKKLFGNKTNIKNYVSNTNYIKKSNNGTYKKITIQLILGNLTVNDIKSIVDGTFINKTTLPNNVPIFYSLEKILSILVNILYYKNNKSSKPNKENFYIKTYQTYRTSENKFILESIYELLCSKFKDKINSINNNDIKTLINNLKKINFLPYSFRDKQKNNGKNKKINDLNEKEDLFKICKDLKEGQNYFYSPNETTILYFGKLDKINSTFMKRISYDFKYYIDQENICNIVELNNDENFKKINFYEFNNTKSSFFNKFKGLFSSKNSSTKVFPTSNSKKTDSNLCEKYNKDELQDINSYKDIDGWIGSYCKKNNINIGNKISINVASENFTNESFIDFKGTEIYDAGAGNNDCLIRSLLFCMSENYRKLDDEGRNYVGSYFRRAFLPWFFKENKNFFKNSSGTPIFTEKNNILYIKDFTSGKKENTLVEINSGLLCPSKFLPDKIGELLCKKLGLNLLIFRPYNNSSIQNYIPVFINNESNFTISICGDNSHFRSCKINYNGNAEKTFILNKSANDVEESVKKIIKTKSPNISFTNFKNNSCFTFESKIYKIHSRLFGNIKNSNEPVILYLFAYIPTQKINDNSILNIQSIKNLINKKDPKIFKLDGINITEYSDSNKISKNDYNTNNLYFYDNNDIYKIYVIDYQTNKNNITEVGC